MYPTSLLTRSVRCTFLFFLAFILIWSACPRPTSAATVLDFTFGNGGKVSTDFFDSNDDANGLIIQPDGKIVVAGTASFHGMSQDFALARYNPNGSLDATFGIGGMVTTDFFASSDVAFAIALQPDGKIVAAGTAYNGGAKGDFALARYTSDGALDSTFGLGGKVFLNYGVDDEVRAVLVQADGKIVVAGTCTNINTGNRDFALARYTSEGVIDWTFSDGVVRTDFFGSDDQVNALSVQPDGKIIAAGLATASPSGLTDVALARYNVNGSLDSSFGVGGKLTVDFGAKDEARALVLQSDGRILVAGVAGSGGTTNDFAALRFNSDGSLDPSFGLGGRVTTDFFGGVDEASAVALEDNGKLVLAGHAYHSAAIEFAVACYNPDGSVDSTFGAGGKLTTNFTDNFGATKNAFARAVAIQKDKKIVVAGTSVNNLGHGDFALARFTNGPSFDLCIQDDSSSNLLQINITTGDYQFTNCGGLTLAGIGTLTKRGSLITLQHNGSDRRVMAKVDTATGKATASVQLLSQGTMFSITDRNIANNTCACQ